MAEKFEVLNDREHTLRKAHIMVGGLVEEDYSVYISGTWKNLRVVPGLLVIVREIMDNKKIFLVNLSKGRLGDINANLLGMIFVMKFQQAAMSRQDIRVQ